MTTANSSEYNCGGWVICRPAPTYYTQGSAFGIQLMSDLHIGAANVNYGLIRHELAQAKSRGDRILLNGDIFDMILTRDTKRYTPVALHPKLQGRNNIINRAIQWAEHLLAPYADSIDMIGVGNHETTVEKHHNVDPTQALVEKLQAHVTKSDHVIHYGGYSGYVDYRFRYNYTDKKARKGCCGKRYLIHYHHGSGGSSPITKGIGDLFRKQWVNADVHWIGHKHNRLNLHIQAVDCPQSGDELIVRDVRQIMTGSYFDTYKAQSQSSLKRNGRRSNYAADMGLAPQGQGGARLTLSFETPGKPIRVEVTQ